MQLLMCLLLYCVGLELLERVLFENLHKPISKLQVLLWSNVGQYVTILIVIKKEMVQLTC